MYASDITKTYFWLSKICSANVTKMSLKRWQVSKKSYWDFPSILSEDFLTSPQDFGQKYIFYFLYMTKEHFFCWSKRPPYGLLLDVLLIRGVTTFAQKFTFLLFQPFFAFFSIFFIYLFGIFVKQLTY